MTAKAFLERDLYPPVKQFLEAQGFTVFSEVNGCDVVATSLGRTVIIELKTAFNLKLIYQAIDRQAISDEVYVAIPRPRSENTQQWKSMLRLLKRLGLGLLTVSLDSPLALVNVLLTPKESLAWKSKKKKEKLEAEISGRSVDQNVGGISKQKIVTAYREKAIELCCVLYYLKEAPLSDLRAFGFEQKQILMLSANFYGWFCRHKKGVYALSEAGLSMLTSGEFQALVNYYKEKWKGI